EQVRAYAKEFTIVDTETGEDRDRLPTDFFPMSAMESAPDLSVMAKARAAFHGPYGTGISQLFNGIGGSEYIASLLMGYQEAPACAPEDFSGYYNNAFPNGGVPETCKDELGVSTVQGSWIAMPPPFYEDVITYADGHPANVEHLSEDVASFLTWTAEPKLVARKQTGFIAVLMLGALACLLYLTNKRLWAGIKGKKKSI
ncbi:MAG: cytochrome c1, partial [Paracoccaceae bacterium]